MTSHVFENLDENIRIAVRALIKRGTKVLVQRKVYEDGTERFVLPGGGPQSNETLEQGLVRECLEEIGTEVQIKKLLHIADFFKQRDTEPPSTRHQLEVIFLCEVADTYQAGNGPHPDKHQVDVIWLENAHQHDAFWPTGLAGNISVTASAQPVYLGLIE